MRDSPPTGYEQLSDTRALLIDEVCDRFQQGLREGKPSAIEEQLGTVPEDLRTVLLRELILVELRHRQRAGQTPRHEEYQARFPGLESPWLTQVMPQAAQPDVQPKASPASSFPPGFEMLGEVGRGGMGAVFKARDVRLQRLVAVKILSADIAHDPHCLRRFRHEARAASALNHPAICTVHALEEWQGHLYLVLEWIEGQTLRSLLKTRPGLPTVLHWLGQVAQALQVAHAAGIVHRDIKPENLMIRADGLAKVLDFGLARLVNQSAANLTAPGMVMGTARYMSPEQARGEPVGSASDIFSLGIVLHECATGQHPFPAATVGGTLEAIEKQPPISASLHNPEVTAPLENVILQTLAKDARLRPSAAQLAAALKDVARGMPGASAGTMILQLGPAVQPVADMRARRFAVSWKGLGLVLVALATATALWWGWRGAPEDRAPSVRVPGEGDDLQARRNLDAVIARLRALNSGYDGERTFRIDGGAVVELALKVDHLVDVTPLAELKGLKSLLLESSYSAWRSGMLADIGALRHLRLVKFTLQNCRVSSIAACEDMPLEELDLTDSAVHSLSPVAGKKIHNLRIQGTDIRDFTPLRKMSLREAAIGTSGLDSLAVLESSDVVYLNVQGAERLHDLGPLRKMTKLSRLSLNSTPVTDLNPLAGLPLTWLDLGQCSSLKDLTPLAGMSKLAFIDVTRCPIADFTPLQKTGLVALVGVANPRDHQKTLRGIPKLSILNGQSLATLFP